MSFFSKLPSYVKKLPEKLRLGYRCIRAPYFKWVPPGHYYSALPDMTDVAKRSGKIFSLPAEPLPGIDMRAANQLQLLNEFQRFYDNPPFERRLNSRARYYRPNRAFHFQDAFALSAMIQHAKPAKIIEIGCGFSSCVILDTCEALQWTTRLLFIEPEPETLLRLTRLEDRGRFELRQQLIQDVPLDVFKELRNGDILFVDTSHVSKVGSDVNHTIFEILPVLKPGVIVHFHDIWYPFEYPHDWLVQGMFWNEAYLLRAFLMFNDRFEILMFNSYLNLAMADRISGRFPLLLKEPGTSIWLRRTRN